MPGSHTGRQRPMFATGLQVRLDQVSHLVHARPGYVGLQPGRRAQGEGNELIRDIAGIDRLESEARNNRYHGQLGQLPNHHEDQVVELGGTQRRPWESRISNHSLGGEL